jgi:uncharacterized protein YyaL (SSP411 family)
LARSLCVPHGEVTYFKDDWQGTQMMKHSARFSVLASLFVLALTFQGFAAPAQKGASEAKTLRAQTQAATDALEQWYVPESGLYRTTGWWNSGNAITALANFSRVSGTEKYLPVFANTLRAAQTGHDGAKGFINTYYDDEGWWALAWIDVYDLTHDATYLRMADSIFSDMQLGNGELRGRSVVEQGHEGEERDRERVVSDGGCIAGQP